MNTDDRKVLYWTNALVLRSLSNKSSHNDYEVEVEGIEETFNLDLKSIKCCLWFQEDTQKKNVNICDRFDGIQPSNSSEVDDGSSDGDYITEEEDDLLMNLEDL